MIPSLKEAVAGLAVTYRERECMDVLIEVYELPLQAVVNPTLRITEDIDMGFVLTNELDGQEHDIVVLSRQVTGVCLAQVKYSYYDIKGNDGVIVSEYRVIEINGRLITVTKKSGNEYTVMCYADGSQLYSITKYSNITETSTDITYLSYHADGSLAMADGGGKARVYNILNKLRDEYASLHTQLERTRSEALVKAVSKARFSWIQHMLKMSDELMFYLAEYVGSQR